MTQLQTPEPATGRRPVHPLPVRIAHWINAYALICMILSGWQIYNASPLFGFSFPPQVTLGGWLAAGIAWHFAAMWLLVLNGLFYVTYGIASGHFRRSLLPIRPSAVWHDFRAALGFRLEHRIGRYNAVQRLLYVVVLLLGVLAVVTGLAIWKPVQLHWLTSLFGNYATARYVHFFAMTGICAFIVVHLALVALVPSTLLPMITGCARRQHRDTAAEARP